VPSLGGEGPACDEAPTTVHPGEGGGDGGGPVRLGARPVFPKKKRVSDLSADDHSPVRLAAGPGFAAEGIDPKEPSARQKAQNTGRRARFFGVFSRYAGVGFVRFGSLSRASGIVESSKLNAIDALFFGCDIYMAQDRRKISDSALDLLRRGTKCLGV
jgi:hypothetical protein